MLRRPTSQIPQSMQLHRLVTKYLRCSTDNAMASLVPVSVLSKRPFFPIMSKLRCHSQRGGRRKSN